MMQGNLRMLENEAFQPPKVAGRHWSDRCRCRSFAGAGGGGGGGKTARALDILVSPSLATFKFFVSKNRVHCGKDAIGAVIYET